MKTRSLVLLAIGGEGALVALALVLARWRGIPLEFGSATSGVVFGCLAAAGLGLANLYLLCHAPTIGPIRSLRRLYVEALRPLFSGVGVTAVVAISVAAGLGEELFFRGVLQAELGLIAASVIFGIAHMGGAGTLAFGCWAGVIGVLLGSLAIWTDGLIAPIVAHTVYDAAAMSYIRWGRECPAVGVAAVSADTGAERSEGDS